MPTKPASLRELINTPAPVALLQAHGTGAFVFACPYAARDIPTRFDNLGLTQSQQQSPISWHSGTLDLATHLATSLDSPLVHSTVSRLVYDCAQPANAPEAIIAKQDSISVPGNAAVSKQERTARFEEYYLPFRNLLNETIASRRQPPILVTIYSFPPDQDARLTQPDVRVCFGKDNRLADAILQAAQKVTALNINVEKVKTDTTIGTHILEQFGDRNGIRSVQIELRSDLLATTKSQASTAVLIAQLLSETLRNIQNTGSRQAR